MGEKFVTVAEVAEMLNESPYTIRDWVARKKIPYFKRGKRLQFDVEEIRNWDKQCNYHPVQPWMKAGADTSR